MGIGAMNALFSSQRVAGLLPSQRSRSHALRPTTAHSSQGCRKACCVSRDRRPGRCLKQVGAERLHSPQATHAIAAPASELSVQVREALEKELGYRQIGAELPDNVSLSNIIQSLPPEVFAIDERKAWGAVTLTTGAVAASIFMIANSPWYLLPLAWAFAGTAWTGMFVIGHDCGHRSFSKNKLVEDVVGTIMFMPTSWLRTPRGTPSCRNSRPPGTRRLDPSCAPSWVPHSSSGLPWDTGSSGTSTWTCTLRTRSPGYWSAWQQ